MEASIGREVHHAGACRSLKSIYLQALKKGGALSLARRAARGRLRILCYHGIWLGPDCFPGDSMFMRLDDFARRMQMLQSLGYQVLALEDAIERMQAGTLPDEAVAITIDDGWFGTYQFMLPVLRDLRLPATLYCDTANLEWQKPIPHVLARYLRKMRDGRQLTPETELLYRRATDLGNSATERLAAARAFAAASAIDIQRYLDVRAFDYMSTAELKAARSMGLDVQLHTHRHTLHDFTPAWIGREIEDNKAALRRILGDVKFEHFCYPSGDCSENAAALLEKLGLRSATTLRPGLCRRSDENPMLLPRILDGSHQTDLEFEANLAGAGQWHRRAADLLGRTLRR